LCEVTHRVLAYGPDMRVDDGVWHHVVVVVRRNSGITVYVDGVGRFTAGTTPDNINNSLGVRIGDLADYPALSGEMDEVAAYPTALSSARVAEHYSVGVDEPYPNEPVLTSQQQTTATTLTTSDSRVVEVLGGRSYTVSLIQPWTRFQSSTIFGATVALALTNPATLTYNWPVVNYDDTTDTYTETTTGTLTFTGVTELLVNVDLDQGRVVSITPGEDAQPQGGPFEPSGPLEEQASGGTSRRLQRFHVGGSTFWNYDFSKTSLDSTKVDWPVTLIFWNNAAVDDVKLWGSCNCATEWGLTHSSVGYPGEWWIPDLGSALGGGYCFGNKWHYRVYGDGSTIPHHNYLYSLAWGYFVVGTSHIDHHENCPGEWSGNSEKAEQRIADESRAWWGAFHLERDKVPLHNTYWNHGKGFWRGKHLWRNDGKATKIKTCFAPDRTPISCYP
jgi:Concanavalin A-like lectin/glucanases superfamily